VHGAWRGCCCWCSGVLWGVAQVGEKGSALQAQGCVREKLRFRPVDTGSKIHKKLTLGLNSKYCKTVKVKEMVMFKDPEVDAQAKEKVRSGHNQ